MEGKISGLEHVKAQKDFDPQTSAFLNSVLRQKMKRRDTGDELLRVKSPSTPVHQSGAQGVTKGVFTQHAHEAAGKVESENLPREFSCPQTGAAMDA